MQMVKFDLYRALDLFREDPADSDYQRGWLACLLSLLPSDDPYPHASELERQLRSGE